MKGFLILLWLLIGALLVLAVPSRIRCSKVTSEPPYRQRSQLLVFYFIFVAIGSVVVIEKREEKKRRQFYPAVNSPALQLSTVRRL